ncbi:MAG: glycosyltransferase family 4 protein [Deltaproteobacteria bacterium]|nr:glycosyltransferase family 4 protein [Deltaproteobacteria bacterium]
MQIIINAASANMGGSVTYIRNLVRWLPKVAPRHRFITYVPAATLTELRALETSTMELRRYPFARTGGAARLGFDHALIPALREWTRADLVFSAQGFASGGLRCPQVLLIRNSVYFDPIFERSYRQRGRSLLRNTVRRWASVLSAKVSEAVLFPTIAMQHLVERHVSLRGKLVDAIHYGFDPLAMEGGAPPERLELLRRAREAGSFVLLNVSTYAVHKNFEVLVEALPRLRAQGIPVKLFSTTSRDRTTDKVEYDAMMRRIHDLRVDDLFVELGYVPYEQLGHLYREADASVIPSFAESFGHSVVEAMSFGLPVIASDVPVNTEVSCGVGRYFRVLDPASCADAIAEVVSSPELRAEMSRRSRDASRGFSWEVYARRLVSVFEAVARS